MNYGTFGIAGYDPTLIVNSTTLIIMVRTTHGGCHAAMVTLVDGVLHFVIVLKIITLAGDTMKVW
jgi:hypothetical protein